MRAKRYPSSDAGRPSTTSAWMVCSGHGATGDAEGGNGARRAFAAAHASHHQLAREVATSPARTRSPGGSAAVRAGSWSSPTCPRRRCQSATLSTGTREEAQADAKGTIVRAHSPRAASKGACSGVVEWTVAPDGPKDVVTPFCWSCETDRSESRSEGTKRQSRRDRRNDAFVPLSTSARSVPRPATVMLFPSAKMTAPTSSLKSQKSARSARRVGWAAESRINFWGRGCRCGPAAACSYSLLLRSMSTGSSVRAG